MEGSGSEMSGTEEDEADSSSSISATPPSLTRKPGGNSKNNRIIRNSTPITMEPEVVINEEEEEQQPANVPIGQSRVHKLMTKTTAQQASRSAAPPTNSACLKRPMIHKIPLVAASAAVGGPESKKKTRKTD